MLMPSTASPRVDWLVVDRLSRLMPPSDFSALIQGCRVCNSSHRVATCLQAYMSLRA